METVFRLDLKLAAMKQGEAAGARGDDDGKFLGFAVKPVVAAVAWIVPGDLRIADAGRIGIDRSFVVVDLDLPIRAAWEIGAGDRGLAMGCFTTDGDSR